MKWGNICLTPDSLQNRLSDSVGWGRRFKWPLTFSLASPFWWEVFCFVFNSQSYVVPPPHTQSLVSEGAHSHSLKKIILN